MSKGADTRQAILDRAVHLSSEVGLEGLSLGVLAKDTGMSKSGLYAHFHSKEALQCEVLDAAASRFVDRVVAPALKKPRGLPRIEALFERWIEWETRGLSGGCLFIAAAVEFDDRPGLVRDTVAGHLRDMLGAVARAARISKDEGHFHSDLDDEQFAFEVWGVLLAYQQFTRLLDAPVALDRARTAFVALLERSGGLDVAPR